MTYMKRTEKKGVSALDFFCIGFGAIVGVGWAVSINGWMANCGGPIPAALGYLIILALLIPVGLCYAELVPMFPVAGGGMAFALKAFRSKISMLSGWASLGAMLAIIPWEAIQITDVLGYLIPGIKSGPVLYEVMGSKIYLVTVLIGTAFSLLIYALNRKGLAAAARVQKILCFVLIGAALVGAIAALIGGKAQNLQPVYDASGLEGATHRTLFGGCFAGIVQACYFLAGFETIPQGVEDAGGNVKAVGKAVVLSVALAGVFYAVLLFAFGYAWPWREFVGMDRPAAATMFLSLYPGTAGKVLYWTLTIGAVAGLFTTWNGFFAASANLMMSMGRGRLIPKSFARQNRNGVATRGLGACLILSLAGPLLGANTIDSITCFSSLAFLISWAITCWSLVRLRRKYPNMARPYKIPGGIWTGIFAAVVCTLVLILSFIPSTPFYTKPLPVIMLGGWLLLGAVFYMGAYDQRKGLSEEELEAGVFGITKKGARKKKERK